MEGKKVVVVTGSSGCLGQHIVKLLQEKDETVGEIRLFDVKEYEPCLEYEEKKPMKKIIGDIRDLNSLLEAFDGAHCVIHTAAVIDITANPDVETMQAVNVRGTENVIEACVKKNVPCLVYSSSTDVVAGTEHVFYGTESTTPVPDTFMIGPYGKTKCQSEKIVLRENGRLLADGKTKLRTAALRSTPFFGEGDKHFVYTAMQLAKKHSNYYLRIRSLDERLQVCYVGNAAWAHIKAMQKLATDESISGEVFFVTDDTPILDVHEQFRPFLEAQGIAVSSFVFPYWLAWILLTSIFFLLKIINCFMKVDVDIPPVGVLNYTCSTFFFNRAKATLRLDYQPLYSPEEAHDRSMEYYARVPI